MNTTEIVAEIARRLPKLSHRDVQDVLEVLNELCYAELRKFDGEVHLTGIGKLYVETHLVRVGGVMQSVMRQKYGKEAPSLLPRCTVRFRPSEALRAALNNDKDYENE